MNSELLRLQREAAGLLLRAEKAEKSLAEVRALAEHWPVALHGREKPEVGRTYINGLPSCPAAYSSNPCECGADQANAYRTEARQLLGLEPKP